MSFAMKNSNFYPVLTSRLLIMLLLILSLLFVSCEKDNNDNNEITPQTENYQLGLLPTPASVYSNIPSASAPVPSGALPGSFQLQIPAIPFSQGQQGSCVSCASSMAKSILDHVKYNTSYPNSSIIYSPAFLFNQCHVNPNNCLEGSYVTSNLEVLKDQGICKLSDMTYDQSNCSTQPNSTQRNLAELHKIDHYYKIDPISNSWIKEFINAGLPVLIVFQVDDFFYTATTTSIWKQFSSGSRGYHCTLLYGWDDSKNAFAMLNSWGKNWRNNGTIWVDYNFVQTGSSLIYGKIFTEAYIIQNPAVTNNKPVAQFAATGNTNITTGSSVSFVDQSSNSPSSWSWSFSGATPSSSTAKNPTVTYANPGIFNVSLTVSNQSGSDTKTMTNYIQVNQAVQTPVAQFAATGNTNITTGSSVSFVDQSLSSPTSWSWSFPGGTPSSSTSQNPTVIYSSAGNYSVTLTAGNQSGNNAKTLTNYIQVNQAVQTPVAQFAATGNTNITTGSSVSFVDQSLNSPTSWSWSFPGGTPSSSTSQNPTVIYSSAGNYSVTLTAGNQSGNNAKTLTNYIQVNQAVQTPVAQFAATGSTNIVAGSSVSFVDQSLNSPTSWSWSFPGGTPSSSTSQNPTVIYSSAGNYSVTLTAGNQSGNNAKTLTNYIQVNQAVQTPVAQFAATGSTIIMTGGSVSFIDQSSNNPTSWSWRFTGGTPSSSTSKNPTVTYANPGVYNVSLTVSNQGGTDTKINSSYITVNSDQTSTCGHPFTDPRDGNTYATVSIGSQCWMAEDSRYATPKSLLWNGKRYYEYVDAINIAPKGWHLPSDAEWQTLEVFLGMNPSQANTDGWRGTDQGYNVRVGGSSGLNLGLNGAAYRDNNNYIVFSGFNGGGCYWTSTKYFNNSPSVNSYITIGRLVNLTVPSQIYRFNSDVENNFYSVRFVRD